MGGGLVGEDARLDPVLFELLRYSFDSVTDEILVTVVRGAHTSIIRDGLDVSVAVFDADGRMAAQGFCIPLHLGAIPDAVDAVRAKFADDLVAGDVVILNDPYTGGMHLPDIFMVKPVFDDQGLIAYLVTIADFGDVGGRVPGGRAVDARTVFEEGLRIPPVKYVEAGRVVGQIREIVAQNVRLPRQTVGDMDVCLGALRAGERGLRDTIGRFGRPAVIAFMSQVQDYTEQIARARIARLPDGVFEFEDHLDDGVTSDEPVAIRVRLTVTGDQLHVDFAGTSSQVQASINSTLSSTKSAVYAAVRTLMPQDIANNAGLFRAVSISAPAGCLLNPTAPAPVAERGLTCFRIVDAMLGALAQAAPGEVPAAGEGGPTAFRFAGSSTTGDTVISGDSMMGAWGGRSDRDGIDGVANFAANASNRPIEIIEADLLVRVLRYGLVCDTGGPGQYRGGLSMEREWEIITDEVTVSTRVERMKFAPWGLDGGQPGSKSTATLNATQPFRRGKDHLTLHRGDRIHVRLASGGGYGNPLTRDPQAVLKDWRDEKISTKGAHDQYGVVINTNNATVDQPATDQTRADAKRGR